MRTTTRTGRASRLGRRIRDLCYVLSALFSGFCSLADSGERRKSRRTGHSGVRGGQDKGFVLKLSWPSTAEYRMMKLKKHLSACGGLVGPVNLFPGSNDRGSGKHSDSSPLHAGSGRMGEWR